MSLIDWIVLSVTLLFIIFYGIWKSRGTKNIEGYLLADRKLPWYHVGLSVMATQASAITFLSAPGQGFSDGLRFVQFYFGLPLAMVVLCITFIPMFNKLKVFTAYEFLEKRFDNKTRTLTASLFLLQRGLSTGITIYAPAIILSTILNVDVFYTIIFNGLLVIVYTVYGGTKAVSYTQVLQMSIIFGGLFLAAYMVIHLLPANVGLVDALHIAGKMNKLNAIDTTFDLNNKYNIWSGIIGGFFLQLSYFGTDQSQVGRYLTGSSVTQSRLGLIMNGLVKIPMQFFILLIGVMVFTFYQFHQAPVFFNKVEIEKIRNSEYKEEFTALESNYYTVNKEKQAEVEKLVNAIHSKNEDEINAARTKVQAADKKNTEIKKEVTALMKKNDKKADTNDTNYIFLSFVTQQLPVGVVGILIAVIFLAAMGSTASGLNSLASTTVVDFYKRIFKKEESDAKYLSASRWITLLWGLFCIVVAFYASRLGNLIEAVNILGSLFYGTILGIFLVAFYMKKVGGAAVFYAAILAEIFIIYAWITDLTAFLWLNVIGCVLVMGFAFLIQLIFNKRKPIVT
ncbi:MAG: sodium:solute symporter [Bacteroidetes bacterium]|nr:sodium:solute symporter [Bacteroidota bacterium]